MSTCYINISYHIVSSFHLSVVLICSPLYSIQLDSIQFDLIQYYSIELDLSYCSVLCLISMNGLCLFVLLSVCLLIYLSVWITFCFLFSSLLLSFLYLISFYMNVWHTHLNTCGHSHKYEYMFLLMTRKYYFKSR